VINRPTPSHPGPNRRVTVSRALFGYASTAAVEPGVENVVSASDGLYLVDAGLLERNKQFLDGLYLFDVRELERNKQFLDGLLLEDRAMRDLAKLLTDMMYMKDTAAQETAGGGPGPGPIQAGYWIHEVVFSIT